MVTTWLRAKLGSQTGAGFVEYALLVVLIAVLALVAVKTFGQGVSTQFFTSNSQVG